MTHWLWAFVRLCALALLSFPVRAVEVVIDFERLAHAGAAPSYVSTWVEEGFELRSSVEPDLQEEAFGAWGEDSLDFPGSTSLFEKYAFYEITLERPDGVAFDARGISLAPLTADFGPGTVVFTGDLAGGGASVTQGITFASSMALQPFGFDASFANLVALQWRQSGMTPHQFDDIRLEVAAVPEPATALSAVCGLLLLGAWRWRARLR